MSTAASKKAKSPKTTTAPSRVSSRKVREPERLVNEPVHPKKKRARSKTPAKKASTKKPAAKKAKTSTKKKASTKSPKKASTKSPKKASTKSPKKASGKKKSTKKTAASPKASS